MTTSFRLLFAVQIVAAGAAFTPAWARPASENPQLTPALSERPAPISPWREYAASNPIRCDTCHSPPLD